MTAERGPTSRFGSARVIVSVALIAIALFGCEKNQPAQTKPGILVVSGDTGGWITPCGCASNQSGGLPRRGTFLNNLRSAGDVVYADAGGAAGGTSEYHRIKFESILAGEMEMKIAAHNLGKSEIALGAEYLRAVAAKLKAPFISANVRDSSGQLITEPARIVELNGRKIALVGVASPHYATSELRVDEPRQAIFKAIDSLAGQYDSLIVLAYMPEDELQPLAASLPEADAIVGGPTGQALTPRHVGPALIASATNKGKFLAQLTPPSDASTNWTASIVEMKQDLADDPAQMLNIKAYLVRLAERDFESHETGLVRLASEEMPANYQVAGTASCASCHQQENEQWTHSKHSHAWQTLKDKGFHVDSYCMQCHTDSFGMPGGFISERKTPQRVSVGCETCHGPSREHVNNPKTRTPFQAMDQCVRCHDHENSPAFHLATYWEKIRHGNKQAVMSHGATPIVRK